MTEKGRTPRVLQSHYWRHLNRKFVDVVLPLLIYWKECGVPFTCASSCAPTCIYSPSWTSWAYEGRTNGTHGQIAIIGSPSATWRGKGGGKRLL
jgi:hypothetical protein